MARTRSALLGGTRTYVPHFGAGSWELRIGWGVRCLAMGAVKVGIQLGAANSPFESAARFWHIVDECERLGFDSLWLSERPSGKLPDSLSALAAMAGRTERLKFGTSVLIAPAYNP